MVEVVAEASDDQGETLDLPELLPPGGVGHDGEHELTHVEGVAPVVVGHAAVVPPHRAQPSEILRHLAFVNPKSFNPI